jgi:hypothetical protein
MSASAAAPFLFNWDRPRRRNLAIAGLIGLSFFVHIAGFYLFQVVYPPTVSLLPAPQRVNLIAANSEQAVTLLRWIDAEDPALASTTRRPVRMQRREIGKVEHVPSYLATEPQLKQPPPLVVDLRVPSVQPPGPVQMIRRRAAESSGIQPTRVTFSSELRQLGDAKFVPANFNASTTEPPQNAQFRVAVDSQGVIRYCFPLNSSGNAVLDEQARQHLELCRFQIKPAPSTVEGLVWGIATIEWGNDIAPAQAKQTPSAP